MSAAEQSDGAFSQAGCDRVNALSREYQARWDERIARGEDPLKGAAISYPISGCYGLSRGGVWS